MVEKGLLSSEAATALGISYSTPPGLLTFRKEYCKDEVHTDRYSLSSCVLGKVDDANLGLG